MRIVTPPSLDSMWRINFTSRASCSQVCFRSPERSKSIWSPRFPQLQFHIFARWFSHLGRLSRSAINRMAAPGCHAPPVGRPLRDRHPLARFLKRRFWRPKLLAAMFCLGFHNPTRERGTRDGSCRERQNFLICIRFGLSLNPIGQLQNARFTQIAYENDSVDPGNEPS